MKEPLFIPILFNNDTTKQKELICGESKYVDSDIREIMFMHIDAIGEIKEDGVSYAVINCAGVEYVSNYTYKEMKQIYLEHIKE